MTGAPRDLPGADLIASRAESERPERERAPRDLPGADLVASGIEALRRGELTVEALLVAVGARRLRAAGLEVPAPPELPDSPELLLYAAVGAAHPCDAHSRYNGLIRRLVSFERALDWFSSPSGLRPNRGIEMSHRRLHAGCSRRAQTRHVADAGQGRSKITPPLPGSPNSAIHFSDQEPPAASTRARRPIQTR